MIILRFGEEEEAINGQKVVCTKH